MFDSISTSLNFVLVQVPTLAGPFLQSLLPLLGTVIGLAVVPIVLVGLIQVIIYGFDLIAYPAGEESERIIPRPFFIKQRKSLGQIRREKLENKSSVTELTADDIFFAKK